MRRLFHIFFIIATALLFSIEIFAEETPDTLTTCWGKGMDTFVCNDEKRGPDENFDNWCEKGECYFIIRNHEVRMNIAYLKFDMSYIDSMTNAVIGLYPKYAGKMATDSLVVSIFGMTDQSKDDWGDSVLTYNTAPGLEPDADTADYELDENRTVFLTTITFPINDSTWSYSKPSQAMDDFINTDKNDLVTFILFIEEPNSGDELRVYSEENIIRAPFLHGSTIILEKYEYKDIYDIQYTKSNDSEYLNDTIRVTGIVTDTLSYGFYIQSGEGEWNGIYVNDSTNQPVIGDYISLTAKVEEYYNQTQLVTIDFDMISSDNELPEPLSVTDSLDEPLEGVLISLNNVFCVSEADGNGEWIVLLANGDSVKVDEQSFEYTPGLGFRYQLTGIVNYADNEYKIAPRSIEDIIELNDAPEIINPLPDTTVISGFYTIKLDLSDVFYDADRDSLRYEITYDTLGEFEAFIDSDGELALVEDPMGPILESYYGQVNISVKAYDRLGEFAIDTFLLTILDTTNNAPVVANPIFDIETYPGFGVVLTDISKVFYDEDGDSLTFSVSDNSENIYTGINWDGKSIVQYEEDTIYDFYYVDITVVANDGRGGTATVSYMLIVAGEVTDLSSSEENSRIYPNPTTGIMTIQMLDTELEKLFVYNITGNLVKEQTVSGSETILDLTDVTNGIYFVKICTDKGIVFRQVIKN